MRLGDEFSDSTGSRGIGSRLVLSGTAARGAWAGVSVAVEVVGVAPGVGVDVDTVAMLCESVDQSNDTGRAGKDAAPLFEAQVGGDHSGAAFMSATDDVVEEVGGAGVAGQIPKLVQDQQIRVQVAFEPALEGRQRFLLEQVGEWGSEGGEAARSGTKQGCPSVCPRCSCGSSATTGCRELFLV